MEIISFFDGADMGIKYHKHANFLGFISAQCRNHQIKEKWLETLLSLMNASCPKHARTPRKSSKRLKMLFILFQLISKHLTLLNATCKKNLLSFRGSSIVFFLSLSVTSFSVGEHSCSIAWDGPSSEPRSMHEGHVHSLPARDKIYCQTLQRFPTCSYTEFLKAKRSIHAVDQTHM